MKFLNLLFTLSFLLIFYACSFEPSLPVIKYNSEAEELVFIQRDTAVHDTAFISIKGIYEDTLPIKDTIKFHLRDKIDDSNIIDLAYNLATQNNKQDVSIRTTRTNDTIVTFTHKNIDIVPVKIAKVISGDCTELVDVNNNRDYKEKIRLWIFQNNITPDSILVEKMNSFMRQFHYSGHKEFAPKESVVIVKSIKDRKYKFDVDVPGKYFYLYATNDVNSIKPFVEKKISGGFKDASSSPKNDFICNQEGKTGPNCLFMIGIDENWKYEIYPLAFVIVDDVTPTISAYSDASTLFRGGIASEPEINWPRNMYFCKQNIFVNMPRQSKYDITAFVSIHSGSFQGDDYYGYNIPFEISSRGDVESITIGGHRLSGNMLNKKDRERYLEETIEKQKWTKLRINGMHIGNNSIPITATDSRGNTSTSYLEIKLVATHTAPYDELDGRINDIENRLDDLEY